VESPAQRHNLRTILFVIVLCLISSIILSLLATALRDPQQKARELDRSKQMLIAASLLSYDGFFLIQQKSAQWDPEKQSLIPSTTKKKATQDEILTLHKIRIRSRLVDDKGNIHTFKELNIDEEKYIEEHEKSGYAQLQYKLLYEIMPNLPPEQITTETFPKGYIFPVNGFGLWDAIYGYLAVSNDADTVIGGTWYDQAETAGLGAEIASPKWQEQFPGKLIFQQSSDGKTNFDKSPLGLTVIKGNVSEVLGTSPKAKSSLDGISGASMTGKGVSEAYMDSLSPYRPFLIKARQRFEGRNAS